MDIYHFDSNSGLRSSSVPIALYGSQPFIYPLDCTVRHIFFDCNHKTYDNKKISLRYKPLFISYVAHICLLYSLFFRKLKYFFNAL